jgi:hypothetical protein
VGRTARAARGSVPRAALRPAQSTWGKQAASGGARMPSRRDRKAGSAGCSSGSQRTDAVISAHMHQYPAAARVVLTARRPSVTVAEVSLVTPVTGVQAVGGARACVHSFSTSHFAYLSSRHRGTAE